MMNSIRKEICMMQRMLLTHVKGNYCEIKVLETKMDSMGSLTRNGAGK